jgi:hypothetical protein
VAGKQELLYHEQIREHSEPYESLRYIDSSLELENDSSGVLAAGSLANYDRFCGRTIAQAVRCWLPTAAAQVRGLSSHVGFVVDEVALGQVFSENFGFPCQSSFHQILYPHNHPGQLQ